MSRSRGTNRASQQYQRKFNALIEERERVGITLEKMADMLGEMAIADGEIFVPVSVEQLREVEEDPMHGMSIAAMMYARFMLCNITMVGLPGSKAKLTPLHEHSIKKREWSEMQDRGVEELLQHMASGVVTPMMAHVFGVDQLGANVNTNVAFKHLTEEEAGDIIAILLRAQVRRKVVGKRASAAMRERYNIFKAAKWRRKAAKKLVSEALKEKVEPPDEIAP